MQQAQQAMQQGTPYAPRLGMPPPTPGLPPAPPPLPPGTLVGGRYLIQGYIGGGGFAHIYKAQDTVLGHRRALKEAFYRDANTQQQFHLEAEFILNARHPNLVRGYAVFEQAGRFFLVMDYVSGHTVEELTIMQIRATGRPLPEAQILDWVLPICDAVAALHAQPTPIIHRDVKPANIKLTRQGVPVLIDLGLAKLFVQGTRTIGAALAFTPGYAPPEQYQAAGATDNRTDVYGLGASLFYLLTGYQPTEAPARLSATALPRLRQLNPALSERTEAAVLRAMALDPRERQQSAHELKAELQAGRAALVVTPAILAGEAPTSELTEAGVQSIEAPAARNMPCERCGTANLEAARYCMRCGAPLGTEREPGQGGGLRLVTTDGAPVAQALPGIPSAAPASRSLPWVAGLAATASKVLLRRQAADPVEARVLIAGMLAVVTFALSLLAVFSGWLIIFVLPGLALAGWSLWHLSGRMPLDLHRLAWLGLALNACWPGVWLFFVHLATQAAQR